jgi:hypothetical protein
MYYAFDKAFSFVALKGWRTMDMGRDDVGLRGPAIANYYPMLTFIRDTFQFGGGDMGVAMYSAAVQDSVTPKLPDLVQISENFLTTVDGASYFRWEITDTQNGIFLREVYYIFGSAGKTMLTVIYTRPDAGGSEFDAVVDAAMKTMRFNPQIK